MTFKYNYVLCEIVPYAFILGCSFPFFYSRNFLSAGGFNHPVDFAFSGAMIAMAVSSHFKFFHHRAVVFKETHVEFHSFFVKRLKKVVSNIPVRYESFSEIRAIRLPLLGIVQMTLKADGASEPIVIRRSFRRATALFLQLYRSIKQANPAVLIEESLEAYLQKSIS